MDELKSYAKLCSVLFGSPSDTTTAGRVKGLSGMLLFSATCRTFGLEAYGKVMGSSETDLSDEDKIKSAVSDMEGSDSSSRFVKFYAALLSSCMSEEVGSSVSMEGEEDGKSSGFMDMIATIASKMVNALVDKGVGAVEFSKRLEDLGKVSIPKIQEILGKIRSEDKPLSKDSLNKTMAELLAVVDNWATSFKSKSPSRETSVEESAFMKDVKALPTDAEGHRDAPELLRVMTDHGLDPVRPGLLVRVSSASGLFAMVGKLEAAGYLSEKNFCGEQTPKHSASYSVADSMMKSFVRLSRETPGYSSVLLAWPKHGIFSVISFSCSDSDSSSSSWWESLAGGPVPEVSDAASAGAITVPVPFIS